MLHAERIREPLGFCDQTHRVSSRAFNWSLVAIGTFILLSIPEGTGALIGVFFGFGLALNGWIAFGQGRPERGRLWIAKAALFAGLPLMAFFSLNAMQAAWS